MGFVRILRRMTEVLMGIAGVILVSFWIIWMVSAVFGFILMPLSVPVIIYDFVFSKGDHVYARAFVFTAYSAALFFGGVAFHWFTSTKNVEESLVACSKEAADLMPYVRKCRCPRRALDRLSRLVSCIAEIREKI
jgi:hypothetical protein